MSRTALLALVLAAGSPDTPTRTVRVAAAADLRFAFEALARAFAAALPGVKLDVTWGSSGAFHAQLVQRAPFDVFLSADAAYPRQLVTEVGARADDVFPYARGSLAAWVPWSSSLSFEKDGLTALAAPAVKRIAIANPRHAPYGRAAEEALRRTGAWERVKDKLVFADNVAAAAQMAHTGAVDVSLTAWSLVQATEMKAAGRAWRVPADRHAPLLQAGIVLPWAKDVAAARAFRNFLVGPEGQAILAAAGFLPPAG